MNTQPIPRDDYVPLPPPPPVVEKKKRSWLLPGIIGGILGIMIGAALNSGDSSPAIATAPPVTVTRTVNAGTSAPRSTVTKTVIATPKAAPTPAAPASGDTCADAREAILTGSQSEIDQALRALIADRAADQTAREAAQDYFEEDNQTLKDMNIDLVQMACSL